MDDFSKQPSDATPTPPSLQRGTPTTKEEVAQTTGQEAAHEASRPQLRDSTDQEEAAHEASMSQLRDSTNHLAEITRSQELLMRQMEEQLESLRRETKEQKEQMQVFIQNLEEMSKSLGAAVPAIRKASRVDELAQALQTSQQTIVDLKRKLKEAEQKSASSEARFAEATAQIQGLTGKLKQTEKELASTQQELYERRRRDRELEEELNEMRRNAVRINGSTQALTAGFPLSSEIVQAYKIFEEKLQSFVFDTPMRYFRKSIKDQAEYCRGLVEVCERVVREAHDNFMTVALGMFRTNRSDAATISLLGEYLRQNHQRIFSKTELTRSAWSRFVQAHYFNGQDSIAKSLVENMCEIFVFILLSKEEMWVAQEKPNVPYNKSTMILFWTAEHCSEGTVVQGVMPALYSAGQLAVKPVVLVWANRYGFH